ncbi:unnamed protein product [Effrenium voratum]|nr:unnamed protein product [Effrenium voratum]
MTKSERLGQGQSLAARTKKAEEAFLARFRNPGRSKPPQRLPRSQSAQRRTEAGTHRSQEHANLRARAEDSQDVQEQLDSVAAASGLPISDKVTHDTEIQSPIDGLKQECADRPALAELQNKTCDLSKASIKDLRKASVGHGEEELAEEFPKVAEEEDTITVLPPLPGDGHGAPTPGLDAVLQSALEQVVEEAKACFDEAPHSTDDAFPTGFLEEVLRRGTDRMLDSPTCERTRTWREIKGQQDEAVHGDNARDRRCAPELTRSQEDTCFVAKLLQEAEVALREGSNDSLLWDTAQSCTAVSCLPRTLCDSPKVCQERQTQPSNEDGSAVPVEEALPLDDDMDQPKEEAVKTSPWTEQNHSPNISLEEGQEQPYEDGSAALVEEALPLDDDMDQPKEEAVKTSPWTEQNHSPNISLEASLRGDLLMGQVKESAGSSSLSTLPDSMKVSLEEHRSQPFGRADFPPEEASLRDELLMGEPKESAVISSLSIMPDSLKISVSQLQEQQEQPSDEDGGALPLEEASSQDDSFIRQPEEETLDLASLHRLCEQRLSAATRPSVLDVISEDELTDTSALAAATLAGRLAARSGFASSLQEEYTFSSAGGSDAAGTHAPDGLDSLELGGRRDVDPMRSDGAQDKPVALQAEKERLQDAMESADEPGEDGQSHSSPENAKTVSQRKQPRQPRQQQKLSSSFDQLIENADAKIFVPNTLKASAPEPTLPTFVQGEGEGAEGAEGGSQRIHHQSLEHGSGEASSSGPKNPKLKVDKATWLQAGASSAASTALSLARRYGLSLAVLAAGCAYMTAVEMAWQLGPEPEWFA